MHPVILIIGLVILFLVASVFLLYFYLQSRALGLLLDSMGLARVVLWTKLHLYSGYLSRSDYRTLRANAFAPIIIRRTTGGSYSEAEFNTSQIEGFYEGSLLRFIFTTHYLRFHRVRMLNRRNNPKIRRRP